MLMKLRNLATVVVAALFVVTLSTAGAAQDQKLDELLGTWDVKMEDGAREFVFEFFMKDGKLAGKYSGSSGTSEMADLTFTDN
ncbi:MAG: hypothetical protein ACXW2R_06305, partial [Candidatus Aminicenantales bacterium]